MPFKGVDKTYDLSPPTPLTPPLFPPVIEVKLLNRSTKQRHPVAYHGGLTDGPREGGGFVLWGIWWSYGVKLIDTSSSTRADLPAVVVSSPNVSAEREKKRGWGGPDNNIYKAIDFSVIFSLSLLFCKQSKHTSDCQHTEWGYSIAVC